MKDFDELFRDGLQDRRAEVPDGMWEDIALDRAFRKGLSDRKAPVPVGMWGRIQAARGLATGGGGIRKLLVATAALLLLLGAAALFLNDGRSESTGDNLGADAGAGVTLNRTTADPAESTAQQPETSIVPGPFALPPSGRQPVKPRSFAISATPPSAASEMLIPEGANQPPRVDLAVRASEVTAGIETSNVLGWVSSLAEAEKLDLPRVRSAGLGPIIRSRPRTELDILLGGAYANQRLSATSDEAQVLKQAREISEFPTFSPQLTVRLRRPIGRGFRLTAGLTYFEIRNQLEYDRRVGTRSTLIRSNNKIRLLEAPILVSYALSGRKLRATLNAGPVVNLVAGVSGQYLDPTTPDPLDLGGSGLYRRHVGVGWTTSLTTVYRAGPESDYELLLEPWFKAYPRSFTISDAPVREQYWTVGLQVGLRRSF